MKKVFMICIATSFFVACSPEVKSVDYYKENENEANEVLKKCEVTQGSKNDQNCINAKNAINANYMDRMFSGEWQGKGAK